jgi:hypothetical protein
MDRNQSQHQQQARGFGADGLVGHMADLGTQDNWSKNDLLNGTGN